MEDTTVTLADDGDRYLTDEEVEAATGLSATTRWRLRKQRKFPPLIELSPGRKMNTLRQICEWKAERLAAAQARASSEADIVPAGRGRPRKHLLPEDRQPALE